MIRPDSDSSNNVLATKDDVLKLFIVLIISLDADGASERTRAGQFTSPCVLRDIFRRRARFWFAGSVPVIIFMELINY